MAAEPAKSTTRHGSNFAVETRNCASAGLRKTKSSDPLRPPSTTAVRLGVTPPSSTALSNENQPSTTSASAYDQPATFLRTLKRISNGTKVTTIQNSAITPLSTKSARYCITVVTDMRNCTPI